MASERFNEAIRGCIMTENGPLSDDSSYLTTTATAIKNELISEEEDEAYNTGKENNMFNVTAGPIREIKAEGIDSGPKENPSTGKCINFDSVICGVMENHVIIQEEDVKEEKEVPVALNNCFSTKDAEYEDPSFQPAAISDEVNEIHKNPTDENLDHEGGFFKCGTICEETNETPRNSTMEDLKDTYYEEGSSQSVTMCKAVDEVNKNEFELETCVSPCHAETKSMRDSGGLLYDSSRIKLTNVSVIMEDLFQTIARDGSPTHSQKHVNSKFCPCVFCTGKYKLQNKNDNLVEVIVDNEETLESAIKKWISCSLCPARFKFMHNLTRHSAAEHDLYLCTECLQHFQSRSDLQIHLKTHSARKLYFCPFCNFKSRVEAELKVHSRIHETEKIFSCAECFIKFDKSHSLLAHLQKRSFSSANCVDKFKKRTDISQNLDFYSNQKLDVSKLNHILCGTPTNKQGKLPNSYYSAKLKQRSLQFNSKFANAQSGSRNYSSSDECPSTIALNVGKPLQHSSSTTKVNCLGQGNTEQHSCPHCATTFKTKHGLASHSIIHSTSKPLSCMHCSATFKFQIGLSRHLIIHSRKKHFCCAHCNATFGSKADLRQHVVIHQKEKNMMDSNFKTQTDVGSTMEAFACTSCAATFETEFGLLVHSKVHKLKSFSCPRCPATFNFQIRLSRHLANHSTSKLFSCANCSATFKWKAELRRHLANHPNTKPVTNSNVKLHSGNNSTQELFACTFCPATFTSKYVLKHHLLFHSTKRQFSCPYCSMLFKTRAHVIQHLSVHSKKRPFACAKCSDTFKTKRDLRQHEAIHSEERKFSCGECAASFKCKRILQRHLTLHSNEKPFACGQCTAAFRRKDALNVHLALKHKSVVLRPGGHTENNKTKQKITSIISV